MTKEEILKQYFNTYHFLKYVGPPPLLATFTFANTHFKFIPKDVTGYPDGNRVIPITEEEYHHGTIKLEDTVSSKYSEMPHIPVWELTENASREDFI